MAPASTVSGHTLARDPLPNVSRLGKNVMIKKTKIRTPRMKILLERSSRQASLHKERGFRRSAREAGWSAVLVPVSLDGLRCCCGDGGVPDHP